MSAPADFTGTLDFVWNCKTHTRVLSARQVIRSALLMQHIKRSGMLALLSAVPHTPAPVNQLTSRADELIQTKVRVPIQCLPPLCFGPSTLLACTTRTLWQRIVWTLMLKCPLRMREWLVERTARQRLTRRQCLDHKNLPCGNVPKPRSYSSTLSS
jgi:hypothetical protein